MSCSRTPRARRAGFTLIELVVVVAIIAVLLGLLLPAVLKVREAAARMSCVCHFKCTALAHHNYADRHGALPTGTIPHPDLPPEQRLSWWVSVLPYVEQDAVFKQFDLTRGPGDPRNEKPASNRFRNLVCPSSGEHDRETGWWKSPSPLTHIVGVAGVGADAAELPPKHPRAGAFGYDRRTTFADITDSTSNTLLLIETANEPGHWAYGGRATMRAFENDAAYIGPGRAFGGFHNGPPVLVGERTHGCNAAMADGSTRYLSTKTAAEVLEALATVGGKEPLPTDW